MTVDHELRRAPAGRHAVDALKAELTRALDAVHGHAAVPRIREIDRAVRAHADIVRAVELLALEVRREDFAAAIVLANEARGRVLADDQAETGVVGHAVALVGRLHHLAHAAALVVAAAHVGGHVGEQQKLIARMPDRAFGEGESAGQPFDRRFEIDQVGKLATQGGVGHRMPPFCRPEIFRRGTSCASAKTERPVRGSNPGGGQRPGPPRSSPDGRESAVRSARWRRLS